MANEKTDVEQTIEEKGGGAIGWCFFPLALFPLVSLLTYDWRAMPQLATPPAPSSNWIGALGDSFAFWGYAIFGLAIWVVPVMCIVGGICLVAGRRMRPGRRGAFFTLFLFCMACLAQVAQHHAPGIAALLERINVANAGGGVGYLVMTCSLSPLLSDFGATVVVLSVAAMSLVAAIGFHNLVAFFKAIARWAVGGAARIGANRAAGSGDDVDDEARAAYEAAARAREEAKRQREEEKAAARAEKERLKEEKRRERELEKRQKATPPPQAAAPRPSAPDQTAQPPTGDTPADKGPYLLPSVDLLNPLVKTSADHSDVESMSQKLIDTLKLFNIDAVPGYNVKGPVVTKYAIQLAPGTRYSAVTNIADNLKGALHAKSLRIEAPIPGEEFVGVEVPNKSPAGISFREVFESEKWKKMKAELPLLFGKDAAGNELVADLATMPHMLVAGATGQGKSVCLNSLICGLLMSRTPEQLKLIMVDPKSVEFTAYSSLPHLIVPVITDNKKVVFSLHWAVAEMEKRLKLFARAKVRNIYDYNHRPNITQTEMFGDDTAVETDMPRTVPYIVIIIDEVADLMASNGKEVTPDIARLTAKARAAGIHIILATQRPDAKIITGTIKANIPGRVAFKTATSIDSRTILDDTGAENLIGRGDMLFKGKDNILVRAQGAWISDEEIARITSFIEQHSSTDFDARFAKKLSTIKDEQRDIFDEDEGEKPTVEEAAAAKELVKAAANADDFKKAVECIINTRRASTSHFQRQLGWGYNHSAKIMDMLTERGVISPQQGMGPRTILLDQDSLVAILNGGDAASGIAEDVGGGEEAGETLDGADDGDTTDKTEEMP